MNYSSVKKQIPDPTKYLGKLKAQGYNVPDMPPMAEVLAKLAQPLPKPDLSGLSRYKAARMPAPTYTDRINRTPNMTQGPPNPKNTGSLQSRFNSFLGEIGGKVTSGYRSPERQAQLFAAAVKKYGSEKAARKWVAPPGKSHHGVDLDPGPGVFSKAHDITWNKKKFSQATVDTIAKKYGFYRPMQYEGWHFQPKA